VFSANTGSAVHAAVNNPVTFTDTTFEGNVTGGDGGAVRSGAPMTSITGGSATGNEATGKGGAFAFSRPATVIGVVVDGNQAGADGGGISSTMALTIEAATVSGNDSPGEGGGIWTETLTMATSTVVENVAGLSGGGIHFRRAGDHITFDQARSPRPITNSSSTPYDSAGRLAIELRYR